MKNFKKLISERQIIERHKNPLGIFMRIPVYLLLFWSLWAHHLPLIIFTLFVDIILWLFIPPVSHTYPFIESIVKMEVAWIRAEFTRLKLLSILLLVVSVTASIMGLWYHKIVLVLIGFLGLVIFNGIMNKLTKETRQNVSN